MNQSIKIKGQNISYVDVGQGKTVLLLHGWGANKEAFGPVIDGLKDSYRVIALDWPGFGASDEPDRPWTVSDYVDFLQIFIEELALKELIVAAHSFGGRVMIKWAAGKPAALKKLILIDSAGIRPKRSLGWYLRVYSYKAGKRIIKLPLIKQLAGPLLQKKQDQAGSQDYRNASPLMKQTMVRVINEDLTHYLAHIQVPTLLIWGNEDTATPLSDGQTMERLIPDAGLVVLAPAGHYSYLDQYPQFIRTIIYFIEH
jgi:pimeloyl-ACP methyl ester carboxylesterase